MRTCLAVAVLAAAGCGDPARQSVPADKVARVQLDDVYGLYKAHVERFKRPPAKLAQVEPWEPAYANGYAAANEGQVVVRWGAPLTPAAGAAPAVLAYVKDAPEQGGFVLLQDGTVKRLSAAEFRAAPKAGLP
ncbi:MAG TPA: hypothetical protein VGF55_25235 [Gemmataceae bacterium]|jgi:hypothetical protein